MQKINRMYRVSDPFVFFSLCDCTHVILYPVVISSVQVKMNRMRLRIAQRLKDAQNTCAMLTTFNEIDMR